MEINRLLSDELVYELKVRGLPIHNTVLVNRTTLRGALRLEREGLSSFINENINLIPREELNVCAEKLITLSRDIQNFDYSNKDNEYKRLSTRLYHVQNRLKRISVVEEEEQQHRNELLARCLQLVDSLGMIKDTVNVEENPKSVLDQENVLEGSIMDQDNILLPELVTTEDGNQPASTNQDLQNSTMVRLGLEVLQEVEAIRNNFSQNKEALRNSIHHIGGDNIGGRLDTNADFLLNRDMLEGTSQQNYMTSTVHNSVKSKQTYEPYHYTTLNKDVGGRHFRPETRKIVEESVFPRNPLSYKPLQSQDPQLVSDSRCIPKDNSCYMPYVDVSRWRIQFDGETSVTHFLERIEELRLSRGVSKEQLLRSAPELFTKNALIWLRTRNFHSWDELLEQLKNDFQPYDYEFDLMEEIRRRTQGSKERVITYISAMENLFSKLGTNRPSELTRVKLIRRNLLPFIQSQLALHWIESISELIRLCKAVEETEMRTQKFVPPPTNYRQLLEPELAYRKPNMNLTTINQNQVSSIESERTIPQATSSQQANVIQPKEQPSCWNCGKSGHKFRKCKDSRRIFCFRCGHPNVIANSCPCCQQKNGIRRSQ